MMSDLVHELTEWEKAENKRRLGRNMPQKTLYKTGRRINKVVAAKFAEMFDCVVFDEGQFIGGHDTDQFKLCALLATKARFSYVLSGTPFGRDPAPVWTQFFCADLGLTFGQKFTQFRSVFYDAVANNFGIEYKFNQSHDRDLRRLMRNRSITYEDAEFSDLPPVVRQEISVDMTPAMRPYYDQRRKELRDLQNNRTIRLIESKFHQLRAITSGYLVGDVEEGDSVVRIRSDFQLNPKMEAVQTLLASLPEGRKITFYHEYVHTGDLIEAACKKAKMNPARLGGGRDGEKNLARFLNDKKCRTLVAQSKAGGVGTNLQSVCNYCCYFESPTSPQIRRQSEKRFPREGQLHTVYIYDLCMKSTIDEDVLDSLDSGTDLMNRLLGLTGLRL